MPLTTPIVVFLVATVYLLTGAVGLLCVTFSSVARLQGLPPVLRSIAGFWDAFRIGLKASATWPWTWKRWTDG